MTDYPNELRALNGTVVTAAVHQLVEDADGMPAGVVRAVEPPSLLLLPSALLGDGGEDGEQ